MTQKYYSIMTNKGTEYINKQVLNDSEQILADGWYIKLGNGQIDPTADFTDLTSIILDKNSKDYPQITFGKNVEGSYAEIIIPPSLTGEIIREAGLFNEKDELIAIAKTYIDLSQNGNGLEMSVKQRIYISAVPSTINIVYTAIADLITEEFLNETLLNKANVSLDNLDAQGQAILNNKSSVSLDNLSATGEAHFANPSLTNLSDDGIDFINQSKALTTGNVSDNAVVYVDILSRLHSSFDSSKFTIVGNPTITSDGVLKATTNNYLRTTDAIIFSTATTWEISTKIKTPTATGEQSIYSGYVNPFIALVFGNNRKFRFAVGDGSNWFLQNVETSTVFSLDTEYTLLFKYDGANYSLCVDGVLEATATSVSKVANTVLLLGVNRNGVSLGNPNGTLDLKEFLVKVDGVPAFSGNKTGSDSYTIDGNTVTIPYILTKQGSKIADVSSRADVQTVYNALGYAPYYTIDTENQTFTLPMGDLYGQALFRNHKEEINEYLTLDFVNQIHFNYNTAYVTPSDGWVLFNTHLQVSANYLTPKGSNIQVYGSVDNNTVYGHLEELIWNEASSITQGSMTAGIFFVKKGQTVKLYTDEVKYPPNGNYLIASSECIFIPCLK